MKAYALSNPREFVQLTDWRFLRHSKRHMPKKNPHAAALGALGGKAKSARKLAALKKSLAKARESRWPKKRAHARDN